MSGTPSGSAAAPPDLQSAGNDAAQRPALAPPRSSVGRQLSAFAGAVIVWAVVATLLDRLLRLALPGYAAAEPLLMFTLVMKWARLILAAAASLSAGYVLGRWASRARLLPLIFGVLLLAMFLPTHYALWNKFPIWYHLVFLLSIVPLVLAGARMGARNALAK